MQLIVISLSVARGLFSMDGYSNWLSAIQHHWRPKRVCVCVCVPSQCNSMRNTCGAWNFSQVFHPIRQTWSVSACTYVYIFAHICTCRVYSPRHQHSNCAYEHKRGSGPRWSALIMIIIICNANSPIKFGQIALWVSVPIIVWIKKSATQHKRDDGRRTI